MPEKVFVIIKHEHCENDLDSSMINVLKDERLAYLAAISLTLKEHELDYVFIYYIEKGEHVSPYLDHRLPPTMDEERFRGWSKSLLNVISHYKKRALMDAHSYFVNEYVKDQGTKVKSFNYLAISEYPSWCLEIPVDQLKDFLHWIRRFIKTPYYKHDSDTSIHSV